MPKRSEPAAASNVLTLEGELDLHVAPRITEDLNALIARQPAQLVVDLSRVTYVDSSCLAVFIQAMQKMEKAGGKFALVGMQESVRSIFEIARLDQVFRIFPDLAAAAVAV